MLYFGKVYNATAAGGVIRCVACERCGRHFFYQLIRMGSGFAAASYNVGQESAEAQAQSRAEASVAAALQVGCEVVPCPYCGHIQQQMIDFLRSRTYRALVVLSWLLPCIGLFVTGFIALAKWANQPRREPDYSLCIIAAAGCLGLAPLLLGIRKWLLGRGTWLQKCINSAPLALIPEGVADETGQIPLRPVARGPIEQSGIIQPS